MPKKKTSKKKKKMRPTPKRMKFLKLKIEHPDWTDTKCARAAGYAESTIHNMNKNIVNHCSATMKEAMDKAGLTTDFISKSLKEGFNATKKTYFHKDGKVKQTKTDTDFAVRAKYNELAGKFRKDFFDMNLQLPDTPMSVTIPEKESQRIAQEISQFIKAPKGKRKKK